MLLASLNLRMTLENYVTYISQYNTNTRVRYSYAIKNLEQGLDPVEEVHCESWLGASLNLSMTLENYVMYIFLNMIQTHMVVATLLRRKTKAYGFF